MEGTVTNWGQALWVSLAGAMAGLFSALPRVLGFTDDHMLKDMLGEGR